MNILIFYQYFGTPKGSWSTRIYEFARRWVKKGHQVTVVTSPYEKSDIKVERFITKSEIEGINLIIINSPDSNRKSTIKRAVNAVRFAFMSIWYALTYRYDVVLASSGPITVGIPALAARWFRRKKMVFEVRDLWPQGAVELGIMRNRLIIRLAFWFEKLCYRNASLVIACSKGMITSITDRFPDVPISEVSNASDLELFRAVNTITDRNNSDNIKYFIYAGSLGFMDDCIQFVRAAMLIDRTDIRFVIIGEGSERRYLESFSKKNKCIMFLGLIPKEEVVQWYGKAWASLMTFKDYPVLQTNSPNKLFDSLAAGVPVIQNTQGWIKDLIEKNQCGVTVLQNNPERFAEAIICLADNTLERNRLGRNALLTAQTEFNRDILADKYINAIEAL